MPQVISKEFELFEEHIKKQHILLGSDDVDTLFEKAQNPGSRVPESHSRKPLCDDDMFNT